MEELDDIKELLKQLAKAQIESQEKWAESRKEREEEQKKQEKLWAKYHEEREKSKKEQEAYRKEREEEQKKQEKLWAKYHEEREESQKKQDRLWAKYHEEREESKKEQEAYRKEQEKLWAEYREVWEEVRGSLKSIGNQLANISGNWGSSAEELFYRSLKKSLVLGGVQYDKIERNVQARSTEFDILLFNGTASAIVEVKSKGHPKDIREFVERKVKAFHEGYPELKDHKLYFGLASTITNDALVAEAREAGIYLLTQDGSHVEVVNEDVRSY